VDFTTFNFVIHNNINLINHYQNSKENVYWKSLIILLLQRLIIKLLDFELMITILRYVQGAVSKGFQNIKIYSVPQP
jgi:hypothetical protein